MLAQGHFHIAQLPVSLKSQSLLQHYARSQLYDLSGKSSNFKADLQMKKSKVSYLDTMEYLNNYFANDYFAFLHGFLKNR